MLYEANKLTLVQSLSKTAELDPTIGSNRTLSKEKSKLEHGRGEGSSWRHYRDSVDGVAFQGEGLLHGAPAREGWNRKHRRACLRAAY